MMGLKITLNFLYQVAIRDETDILGNARKSMTLQDNRNCLVGTCGRKRISGKVRNMRTWRPDTGRVALLLCAADRP